MNWVLVRVNYPVDSQTEETLPIRAAQNEIGSLFTATGKEHESIRAPLRLIADIRDASSNTASVHSAAFEADVGIRNGNTIIGGAPDPSCEDGRDDSQAAIACRTRTVATVLTRPEMPAVGEVVRI